MKKLIIGVVGIMVLITLGCSTTKTVPLAQTPDHPTPPTNEMALLWFERGNAYVQIRGLRRCCQGFYSGNHHRPQFCRRVLQPRTCFGRLGKHEQAIGDFTQAISLNPKNANAYADRGAAYGSLGQHALAISDFTQAITLNPNFAGAYYNRAIGYFAEKKCAEAQKDVRQAQDLGYQRIRPGFLDDLKKDCPEN